MESASATVSTVSSVKKQFEANSSNSFVLVQVNSWTEPMISPAIAPSI